MTILFFMVARWSWPRFRFDQLMTMAWKVLLPLGLVNLVALAVWVECGERVSRAMGLPPLAVMAAYGWIVLIVAWVGLAWALPNTTDNRPRLKAVGEL